MKYLLSVKEFDVIQPNGSYEQKPDVVLLCLYIPIRHYWVIVQISSQSDCEHSC